MRFRRISALLTLGLSACQALPAIDLGMCGNGVVEPDRGEDCDLSAPEGQRCGLADEGALACRFVLDDTHACPEAYTPGQDTICRRPVGAFTEAAGSTFSSDMAWHALADLDADGAPDLVGLSAQRDAFVLHWGDGQGGFGPRSELSTGEVVSPPGLGPLVGDGADDAILPLLRGLIVLRGSEVRTVQPAAYSTLTVSGNMRDALIVPVNDSPTHSAPLILSDTPAGVMGTAVAVTPGQIITGDPKLMVPGQSIRDLAGRPARGNLEPADDPRGIAEELAIGFVGEARVHVLGLENTARPNAAVAYRLMVRQVVDLPAPLGGATLSAAESFSPERLPDSAAPSAVRFVDVDADGRLDLLAVVAVDGRPAAVVARMQMDGRFGEAMVDPQATAALRLDHPVECAGGDAPSRPSDAGRVPLAAADFNGNGAPDVVMPWGLMMDIGLAGDQAPCAWLPGADIATAVTGDFNRDGHTDLAVTTYADNGITFAFGNGAGGFNTVSVPASGQVDRLRVGDFDGDFIQDVAYAEAATAGILGVDEQATDRPTLRVVFGRTDGRMDLPESRSEMGTFNPIQSIEPYREDRLDSDVTDDLMLLTIPPGADGAVSRAIASLVGTPQRQMLSPLVLQRAAETNPRLDTPVRSLVGHFEGAEAGPQILVIARPPLERGRGVAVAEGEPPALLYLVASQAGAALDPTGAAVDALECAPGFSWENALTVAADLDADGRDELVAVDERAPIEAVLYHQGGPPTPFENDGRVGVLVLRRDGDTWTCVDDALAEKGGQVTALKVADFDGDARPDLALAFSGAGREGDAALTGAVTIYPGDATTFALDAGVSLPLPLSDGARADEGTFPLDLAALALDDDTAAELVVSMFDEGLYRADLDAAGRAPEALSPLLEEADFIGFVATGDVNVDGLSDLVIRGLPRVRVLLGADHPATVRP